MQKSEHDDDEIGDLRRARATRALALACPTMLAAIVLWVAGCAAPNVNPPQAAANKGYVDFHADSSAELSWDVARFDDRAQTFKSVFSELQPPPGGILRLPFAPGHHRLRVTFLNRVIANPAEVEIEIQDGKIIPIRVTLSEAGTASVESKDVTRGGTMRGGYGRRTKISSDESIRYAIAAMAEPSVAYQPRERMPYAR